MTCVDLCSYEIVLFLFGIVVSAVRIDYTYHIKCKVLSNGSSDL